jgi:hypothetical protein
MTTAMMTKTESEDGPGRTVDAGHRAGHVSHQVRLVQSLAANALDDAVHATKQTIKTVKRGVQNFADLP